MFNDKKIISICYDKEALKDWNIKKNNKKTRQYQNS
jgi:hypothetical protein